eukprot:751498-Hanusia_phi.AAC.6
MKTKNVVTYSIRLGRNKCKKRAKPSPASCVSRASAKTQRTFGTPCEMPHHAFLFYGIKTSVLKLDWIDDEDQCALERSVVARSSTGDVMCSRQMRSTIQKFHRIGMGQGEADKID